jgi:tetratricopeptide (TPR) repeat protein
VAAVIAPEIQEVLDEADFFASQGMMDEALEAVQEAILIYPANAALRARLLEYEAKADAQEVAEEQAEAEQPDDSFDIAEQLASELTEVAPTAGVDEMIDVESVFAQFKKGVAAQIAPDDSDTHFDLGIAYKEMGLTDDAIQEFDLAAQNPKRACTALTMIGTCYLERGDAQQAVTYFERAISSPQKSPLEEMALHYEIGNAQELLGRLDAALSSFERVAAHDRTFRGVTSRMDALKKRGVNAAAAR